MSTTYLWNFSNISGYPRSSDQKTTSPFTVEYTYFGVYGQGQQQEITGEVVVNLVSGDAFVDFPSLTHAQLVTWVERALGADLSVMQGRLDWMIANFNNPRLPRLPVPFKNPAYWDIRA